MLPFLMEGTKNQPLIIAPNWVGNMENQKTLLFVDDEEEILEILVDLFSEDGYRLHTATRVNDALEIIDNHSIDFVLSDLRLPDASGSELLCHSDRSLARDKYQVSGPTGPSRVLVRRHSSNALQVHSH